MYNTPPSEAKTAVNNSQFNFQEVDYEVNKQPRFRNVRKCIENTSEYHVHTSIPIRTKSNSQHWHDSEHHDDRLDITLGIEPFD